MIKRASSQWARSSAFVARFVGVMTGLGASALGCGLASDGHTEGTAEGTSQRGLSLAAECSPLNGLERMDVTGGVVNASAQVGDTLYLAGSFAYIGEPTGSWVALRTDGVAAPAPVPPALDAGAPGLTDAGSQRDEPAVRDTGYPQLEGGEVRVTIEDGAGGYYIGGTFRRAGTTRPRALTHILADKSVDRDFAFPATGVVHALALVGDILYVGGDFTSLGGQPRSMLGAIDTLSHTVTAWDPHVLGDPQQVQPSVFTILPHAGALIIGGYFNSVHGVARKNLTAVDAVTGALTLWSGPTDTPGSGVHALALYDDTLFIGGTFGLGTLQVSTGALDVWGFARGPDWEVQSLVASGDTLYVSGSFSQFAKQPRSGVAALHVPTRTLLPWAPQLEQHLEPLLDFMASTAPAQVEALALDPEHGAVYLGGTFNFVGGARRENLAAVDASSGAVLPLTGHASHVVHSLYRAGAELFVGGDFTSLGGAPRSNLAAIDLNTGRALPWAPEVIGPARALTVVGDRVFVGGLFPFGHDCDVNVSRGLAVFDAVSGSSLSFEPLIDQSIYRLSASSSALYAASSNPSLIRVDLETGVRLPFSVSERTNAPASVLVGDALYVAINQDDKAGQVQRMDATSGAVDAAFTLTTEGGSISALAADATTLYLAGIFASVNGVPRHQLAAVTLPDGTLTAWNPGLADPQPRYQDLRALQLGAGTLYVGGNFLSLAGQPRNHLAAFELATGQLTALAPLINRGDTRVWRLEPDVVTGLSYADGHLNASGNFYSVGSIDRSGLSRFCVGE
jgi:hypothetical protein